MDDEVDVLRRAYAEKSIECETLRQECFQYVELLRRKSVRARPRSKRIQVNMNIRFGKSVGVQTYDGLLASTDKRTIATRPLEKDFLSNTQAEEKPLVRSASFVNLVQNWERQAIKPKISTNTCRVSSESRSTKNEIIEKDYKRKFRDLMNDWQRAVVNGETMNSESLD